MKWIKYQIAQSVIDEETILIEKKVGYSEANLAIAQSEAYNGNYAIEEDSESYNNEPLAIEFGGTGANNANDAANNLCEVGTWTPQFSVESPIFPVENAENSEINVTYRSQYGEYIRIGKLVNAYWYLSFIIESELAITGFTYNTKQSMPAAYGSQDYSYEATINNETYYLELTDTISAGSTITLNADSNGKPVTTNGVYVYTSQNEGTRLANTTLTFETVIGGKAIEGDILVKGFPYLFKNIVFPASYGIVTRLSIPNMETNKEYHWQGYKNTDYVKLCGKDAIYIEISDSNAGVCYLGGQITYTID